MGEIAKRRCEGWVDSTFKNWIVDLFFLFLNLSSLYHYIGALSFENLSMTKE